MSEFIDSELEAERDKRRCLAEQVERFDYQYWHLVRLLSYVCQQLDGGQPDTVLGYELAGWWEKHRDLEPRMANAIARAKVLPPDELTEDEIKLLNYSEDPSVGL